jgi:hypothetical protein
MDELKKICDKLKISYYVFLEKNNFTVNTHEILHKEFIIRRILYKIKNNPNQIIPVIYSKNIQNYNDTNNVSENDYVYYGQYSTTDKNILNLMKKLTDNKFKFGAVSQKLVKLCWKNNVLITYKQLARAWIKKSSSGKVDFKELAFNNFMKKYNDINKWNHLKNKIIKFFIKIKLLE